MERDQFSDVGKVDEIPVGKMKHAEVTGNEIVVANVEGEKRMTNKHNHDQQVLLKQEGIQLHDKDSVTDKEFALDIQSQENGSIDKVLIIGLGQLGLPVAKYVREKGFDTYGYDISVAAMERAQKIASIKGVTNFGEIDAFIICVSTHKPEDMSTPQIEGLLSVVQEISMKAKNGALACRTCPP